MKPKLQTLLVVLLMLSVTLPAPAMGKVEVATILVTTTADEFNSQPNATCSLREALYAANNDVAFGGCIAGAQRDEIILPPGEYRLSRSGTPENQGASGDLDITANVDIYGSGSDNTVIIGNGSERVIHINGILTVTMRNLRIKGGKALGNGEAGNGGGIYMQGTATGASVSLYDMVFEGNTANYNGGGIANLGGSLDVRDTDFHGNVAANGGAIFNNGLLVMKRSAIYNNDADYGGGLYNSVTSILENVTLSGNSANLDQEDINGEIGQGGGIFNDGTRLSLWNVTLADNTGDGLRNQGLSDIQNTLFARNGNFNCSQIDGVLPTDTGGTLEQGSGAGDCGVATAADVKLGTLADYGGKTLTQELMPNSPAIDHGSDEKCLATDQRGYARPVDGDQNGSSVCDVGAYEAGAEPPPPGGDLFLPLLTR